jgi:predicted Ser/Thr protein kinase
MKKQRGAIDFSSIERAIVTVKGQNVIIDSDVARIYGVETNVTTLKSGYSEGPQITQIEKDKSVRELTLISPIWHRQIGVVN